MQITYQKKDGCIFQRLRKTMLPYKIGEETSMGWKVLNIEYEYNNKYYSYFDYNMIIRNNKFKAVRKMQMSKLILRELKALLYYSLIVIVLKCILGI